MTAEKARQIRRLGQPFNETIQLPDFADELDGHPPTDPHTPHMRTAEYDVPISRHDAPELCPQLVSPTPSAIAI
jgi:hypothetical protein